MMLGVVASDGKKMDPVFFDKKPNGKGIDQTTYIQVLEDHVLPWIRSTYESRDIAYVWTQVLSTQKLINNLQ